MLHIRGIPRMLHRTRRPTRERAHRDIYRSINNQDSDCFPPNTGSGKPVVFAILGTQKIVPQKQKRRRGGEAPPHA